MKFAFALLPIAAVLGFVQAGPVFDESLDMLAPVPVTKLVCDGNSYKCTASLKYGDGNWVAEWSTAVFHQSMFGYADVEQTTSLAPVPVTSITCDGNTHKCTGKLRYSDNRWVAQWASKVFHQVNFQALFDDQEFDNAMAPVNVKKLTCDGNTHKCTANLEYGDGHWVAQWGVRVFHL